LISPLAVYVIGEGSDRKDSAVMQQRTPGGEVKQIPLRLDRALYEELSRRSTIEKKSMSDIVRDALRSHFASVRVTKPQLRAAIERIAREDAEILEALGKGPEEQSNGVDRLSGRR
jgi:hypothetical protein